MNRFNTCFIALAHSAPVMLIPLALVGIAAGFSSLLFWPVLGGYSLLLYPVLGSSGAALFAVVAPRAEKAETDLFGMTDRLVAELRQKLDQTTPASRPADDSSEDRKAG